ncbi:hypothetical protein FPL14_01515 [Cohnella cholangitidis]|uniref:GRAM domain-containing protein n=2 Tax=Cohnella cholangitidis TaxID=2598458 RepID=A0A7G5C6K2_9BACL|nr:hypothetical protein FPL14_01515 [Cohnella cholangitidis]
MDLRPSELFLLEKVAANLFRGIESVGGRLSITNERLVFEPHAINIQSNILELNVQDIVKVEKRNNLLVVPNGMKLTTGDGKEYKFVIWNRSKIIELLNQTIKQAQQVIIS